MSRITVNDILQAVISQVHTCMPDAELYKGRLEEGFSRPAFLFLPVYMGERKANYFTARRDLEIQIIFFATTDGYGNEDIWGRCGLDETLAPFLQAYRLAVGDRHIPFTYEMKEADSQMAIYLTFRYLEEALDSRYVADMAAVPADSVQLETEVREK